MLPFFDSNASEKFSIDTDKKEGVPRCGSSKTEIIHPHCTQTSQGSVKAHFDGPTARRSGQAVSPSTIQIRMASTDEKLKVNKPRVTSSENAS